MGFLSERKKAKELDEVVKLVQNFKKEIAAMGDKITDVQGVYDKCEELLKRIGPAKAIDKEYLDKTADLLRNCWFAARDAIASEYNIYRNTLNFLNNAEAEFSALKAKMLESGAKQAETSAQEPQPGE